MTVSPESILDARTIRNIKLDLVFYLISYYFQRLLSSKTHVHSTQLRRVESVDKIVGNLESTKHDWTMVIRSTISQVQTMTAEPSLAVSVNARPINFETFVWEIFRNNDNE